MFAAAATLVLLVLRVIELAVIAAVVSGWLQLDRDNPVVRLLRETTEPLFNFVRPIARRIPGDIDWSPAIVLFTIELTRAIMARIG
jgi:YggT family protein